MKFPTILISIAFMIIRCVAPAQASTLRGTLQKEAQVSPLQMRENKEVSTTNTTTSTNVTYHVEIDASLPSSSELAINCVSSTMEGLLKEWAKGDTTHGKFIKSFAPVTAISIKGNDDSSSDNNDRQLVILAVTPNLKVSITLTANNGSCARCSNKSGVGARLLAKANKSGKKELKALSNLVAFTLPKVCTGMTVVSALATEMAVSSVHK